MIGWDSVLGDEKDAEEGGGCCEDGHDPEYPGVGDVVHDDTADYEAEDCAECAGPDEEGEGDVAFLGVGECLDY